MAISHVFSNTIGDWTGTVTVFDSAGVTATVAATNLVRPVDWNSAHNHFYTLTGNTSNNTTASGTNVLLSGGSNVTLEGTGSRIGIHGAGPPTLSFYDNLLPGSTQTSALGQAMLHVFPFSPANEVFPGNLSALSVFLNVTGTVSTAAAFTVSYSIAFWTSVNSTQISRVFSASSTWGTNAGNMNINDSFGGFRWLSFASSQFDTAPVFEAHKRYWCGIWSRTSSGTPNFSHFGMMSLGMSNSRSGILGNVSEANNSRGWGRFQGHYFTGVSSSFSSAMPDTLDASNIHKRFAGAPFIPQVILNNVGTDIV